MTTTTANTRKRPYQPSITSFFANRDTPTAPSQQSSLSPPLPADTQASLLSVGMRVRKSVPEGYKTHKTLAAPGFPFPSSAPATTTTTLKRGSGGGARTRELTPFCGLHKTGGWSVQSSAPAVMEEEAEEDDGLPGMTWSQTTADSTQGSFGGSGWSGQAGAGTRKRGYDEEVEEELDAFFDGIDSLDADGHLSEVANRPIARMKGMKGVNRSAGPVVTVVDDFDFEEADFLSPGDGMEVDSL